LAPGGIAGLLHPRAARDEGRSAGGAEIRVRMMESFFSDLRYGIRNLLKRPGFTAVAVITLALGIGANTAIFTLLNAVTFKTLPVNKPQELVQFHDGSDEGTSTGDASSGEWQRFSYASYQYFLDHDQNYQGLS